MGETRMTRDFFLWCMSVIYLFAFTSLYVQIPGLYGENGLLPAKLVVHKEVESFSDLVSGQPTLLRLISKIGLDVQTGMDFLSLGGIILAFVAAICKTQRNTIVFAALWVFYLSIFQVGQTFLWFQWDILLLEVGFLTVLVAPLNLFRWRRGVWHHQHDTITLWLIKWLLFRLMFSSGVVKLNSQCPTWWGLTALNYHYETQCIPTPLAWVFHQFPEWWQKLCVVSVYVIQIPIPFLFFSPVRAHRLLAFYAQFMLMLLIFITGNYNFFNLLTLALCVVLLDDNFLRYCLGKPRPVEDADEGSKYPVVGVLWQPFQWALNLVVYGGLLYWTIRLFTLRTRTKPLRVDSEINFDFEDLQRFLEVAVPVSIWLGALSLIWEIIKAVARSLFLERGLFRKFTSVLGCVIFATAAVGMFAISLVPHTMTEVNTAQNLWPAVKQLHQTSRPFKLTSPYGLFRRMTGVEGRPEVIIEGSNDVDSGWKEYNFLYKPGNVTEVLSVVAPHQPRLDWQMWFAALGSYQHNPWFLNMVYRLLNNQPEVLQLMGRNPFPESPPKYIRATLYHYHFSVWDKKSQRYSESDWWVRKKVREYLPIVSLNEPSFVNFLKQAGIYKKKNNPGHNPGETNFLKYAIKFIRRWVGQPEGFMTIVALTVSAIVLTLLDPNIHLVDLHWPEV